MAISKGAKRTDGLESAEQVQMVVEEIAKKSHDLPPRLDTTLS